LALTHNEEDFHSVGEVKKESRDRPRTKGKEDTSKLRQRINNALKDNENDELKEFLL